MFDRLTAPARHGAYAQGGYESVRVFRALSGLTIPPAWEEADPRERAALEVAVADLFENDDPASLHARWYARAAAAGWRYGEALSHDARTHPAFLPYAALDPHQRTIFLVFIDSVKLHLNALLYAWAGQGEA